MVITVTGGKQRLLGDLEVFGSGTVIFNKMVTESPKRKVTYSAKGEMKRKTERLWLIESQNFIGLMIY